MPFEGQTRTIGGKRQIYERRGGRYGWFDIPTTKAPAPPPYKPPSLTPPAPKPAPAPRPVAPPTGAGSAAIRAALLAGFAPKPAPKPAAAPSGVPAGPSVPMQIEPGAWLNLQETILAAELQWRAEQAEIEAARVEQEAMEMELRLSTSPIDFVAYELYKREREAAGQKTWTGPSQTDPNIQGMVAAMVGEGGGTLGTGEFGVQVPRTEAISRAESREISPSEMDILGSFLKAGFDVGGQEVSYNPEDYWREVEEGFVPTIQTKGPTRYSF